MNNKYSEIYLTYQVGGECLLQKDKYQEAKINVTNSFRRDEKCVIVNPMKILSEPVFEYAVQKVTLGKEFIENALTKPEPSKKKLNFKNSKFITSWGRTSQIEKIKFAIEKYVDDLGGTNPSFEIW